VRGGEKPVSDPPNACPGGAMMMHSLYRIAGSVGDIQRGKLIVHSVDRGLFECALHTIELYLLLKNSHILYKQVLEAL